MSPSFRDITADQSRIRQAIRELEAELERRLRELSPGWAIGYRLKNTGTRGSLFDDPERFARFQFHTVEILEGTATPVLDGFHYVVLKENR